MDLFAKRKPPLMVVVPPSMPMEVAEEIREAFESAREFDDIAIRLTAGASILQCVNGEWIPLPLPTPDEDEPPARRTLD